MFLQILEGNRQTVCKMYHRMVADDRHHTPTLIECVPIESRLFGTWSMQMVRLIDFNPEVTRRLILQYSDSTAFQPHLMTPHQSLEFAKNIVKLQRAKLAKKNDNSAQGNGQMASVA